MLDARIMTSVQLQVVSEDQSTHKWCVPLKEDVFGAFIAKGGPIVHKVFGDKSLFGPLLFKKFFDPSDAFPLWEFEPGVLLSDLQNPCVDWFQTEACYVLKSELPSKSLCSFLQPYYFMKLYMFSRKKLKKKQTYLTK